MHKNERFCPLSHFFYYLCRMKRIFAFIILAGLCLGAMADPMNPSSPKDHNKKKNHNSVTYPLNDNGPDPAVPVAVRDMTMENPPIVDAGRLSGFHRTGRLAFRSVEGIDVSHYQYTIDWDKVYNDPSNLSYVYIKACEGENYVDSYYERNIKEAHRAGLYVGAYHFYRPNVSPQKQFENMKRVIRPEDQDLVPMIDVEVGGNAPRLLEDLAVLVRLCEDYYGAKPLIYTYQSYYNEHMQGWFHDYPWMMAKYHTTTPNLKDDLDYGWWQYSDHGEIQGITRGHCDRSRMMDGHTLDEIAMPHTRSLPQQAR